MSAIIFLVFLADCNTVDDRTQATAALPVTTPTVEATPSAVPLGVETNASPDAMTQVELMFAVGTPDRLANHPAMAVQPRPGAGLVPFIFLIALDFWPKGDYTDHYFFGRVLANELCVRSTRSFFSIRIRAET